MKRTITDYFDETVRKYPERTGITDSNCELTFREIQRDAVYMAWKLHKCVSGKGNCNSNGNSDSNSNSNGNGPVAIYMKRGAAQAVSVLAALYTGKFYVVLDYDAPFERTEKILKTVNPSVIIYDDMENENFMKIYNKFSDETREDKTEFAVYEQNKENTDDITAEYRKNLLEKYRKNMTENSPAYALFTSGSTGDPKGVLVTHGNVISYIKWFTECFDINEKTSFGSQTPMYFSMSVSDFYASMFKGGCYNMIPAEYFAFPAGLIDYMNSKKVNTLYWVPSAMGIVAKWDLFRFTKALYLEKLMFAGEIMPVKYLNYWRKYLPFGEFANLFGPTETTDICAYYKINREFGDTDSLPIGYPCENCQLIVLKEDESCDEETVKGKAGELYVKGPFVAGGYYRNHVKTRESFVQNPLHNDYIDIVYKTGDLVYENEFGELEYAGRKDFQIKHMGYRIEPGEIENVLNGADSDLMTICIYDEMNDRIICAFEGDMSLENKLVKKAEEGLPLYMRPEKYICMEKFPLNANGKTDRKEIKRRSIKC